MPFEATTNAKGKGLATDQRLRILQSYKKKLLALPSPPVHFRNSAIKIRVIAKECDVSPRRAWVECSYQDPKTGEWHPSDLERVNKTIGRLGSANGGIARARETKEIVLPEQELVEPVVTLNPPARGRKSRGRPAKNPVARLELARRAKQVILTGNVEFDCNELRKGLDRISYQDAYQMTHVEESGHCRIKRLDEISADIKRLESALVDKQRSENVQKNYTSPSTVNDDSSAPMVWEADHAKSELVDSTKEDFLSKPLSADDIVKLIPRNLTGSGKRKRRMKLEDLKPEVHRLIYDENWSRIQVADWIFKTTGKKVVPNTVTNLLVLGSHSESIRHIGKGLFALPAVKEALAFRHGSKVYYHFRIDSTPYGKPDLGFKLLMLKGRLELVVDIGIAREITLEVVEMLVMRMIARAEEFGLIPSSVTTDKERTYWSPLKKLNDLFGTIHIFDRNHFIARAHEDLLDKDIDDYELRNFRHHYYDRLDLCLHQLSTVAFFEEINKLEIEKPVWSRDPLTAKYVSELIQDRDFYGPAIDLPGAFLDNNAIEGFFGNMDDIRRKNDLSRSLKNWAVHIANIISRKNEKIIQKFLDEKAKDERKPDGGSTTTSSDSSSPK